MIPLDVTARGDDPAWLCGDVWRPGDRALAAGQQRLIAPGLVVDGWADLDPRHDTWITSHLADQEMQLADASALRVELNAVIFADGRIAGPDDDGWLEELFTAHVREKQRWYGMVRDALDRSHRVEVRAWRRESLVAQSDPEP